MADEGGTPTSEALGLEPTSVVQAPRRRALWGVLAVVAVAAGALAIAAGGDGDELPTLPVALGASGRDEASGAASADTADLRMGWVTYVAGDGLAELGGEGPVYRLESAVDEDRVRALAAALGLPGDPTHEDGYWRLQSDEAVLEVYEEGGGYWWYGVQQYEIQPAEGGGSPGCEPGPAVDCGVTAPSPILPDAPATTIAERDAAASGTCTTYATEDGTTGEECVTSAEPCPPDAPCPVPAPIEPQPPADLPSEEEARGIALDLLRSTGMDVDDATITVDGPYDAWYLTVELKVDGLPVTGWVSSVSVGSKGAITNASGTLATPELLGDYPLIDTRAAINRLNEQQQVYGYDDVKPLGASGTASSSRESATLEAPADAPLVDPAPTTIAQCAPSPDGTEVCSGAASQPGDIDPGYIECLEPAADPSTGTTGGDGIATDCGPAVCYDAVPPAGDEPATTVPECGPYPEPEPVEVVLHDAERVLVLLPAFDGSGDSYLLSGYRFTGAEGAIVEVAAVADERLAPTTTVPDTTETTPTPTPADPIRLEPGQTPEIGIGYYVDVAVMTGHCSWISVEVADRWWWAELSNEELAAWSSPTEGGTFTLVDGDTAEFVGDADRTKVAKLKQYGDGTQPPLCA